MKQIWNKVRGVAAVVVAAVVLAFTFSSFADSAGYVKTSGTKNTSPTGWSFIQFSAPFAAATDTQYFMFTPAQLRDGDMDTTVARVHTQAVPLFTAASDASVDTVNIAWEVWVATDTTGWWGGSTRSKTRRGIWTVTAIGQDSATAGIVSRSFTIGNNTGGRQPFTMVVAIGKTPSAGKGNNIGNVAKADILQKVPK